MSTPRPIERSWEKELDVLLDEMPDVLARPLRHAYGRHSGVDSFPVSSFGEAILSWHRGFEALAALTYNVGLALIIASQEPGDQKQVSAALLQQLRERHPKNSRAWAGNPEKTLYIWLYLIQHSLKKEIERFVPAPRRPHFLQHLLCIPTADLDTLKKRNEYAHKVGNSTIPGTAFHAEEDLLRSDTRNLFGFWRHYGLGFVGDGSFSFSNKRFGRLPHTYAHKVPQQSGLLAGGDIRTVVLIERPVSHPPVLWDLSPFVFYEQFSKEMLRNLGVEESGYRPGVFRHLDWRHGRRPETYWHGLYSVRTLEERTSQDPDLDMEAILKHARGRERRFKLGADAAHKLTSPIEREMKSLTFIMDKHSLEAPAVQAGESSAGPNIGKLRIDPTENLATGSAGTVIDDIGTCVVLRARPWEGEGHFAVKVLRRDVDPRSKEAFQREKAFLIRQRNRPRSLDCFPKLIGWGTIGGGSSVLNEQEFFAQEYVGHNLRSTIDAKLREQARQAEKRRKPHRTSGSCWPSEEEVLTAVKLIAKALYMTERIAQTLVRVYESETATITRGEEEPRDVHFLHRDITPENLLDAGAGRIYLCDFNSAYLCGENEGIHFHDEIPTRRIEYVYNTHLSRKYCAPEVWSMPPLYSNTADVFSVGIVLNELLFGTPGNTQQTAEEMGYRDCRSHEDVERAAERLGKPMSFYTPPGENSVERIALTRLEQYAARLPQGTVAPFDLAAIVGEATAPWPTRCTMRQLLNMVSTAGRTARMFLSHQTREAVDQALAQPGSESPEPLLKALRIAAAALGWHDVDQHSDGPLQMILCEQCYASRAEWDDSPPVSRPCLQGGSEKLLGKIRSARGWVSLNEDCGPSIEEDRLREVLEMTKNALTLCPGLVDIEPEQTAKLDDVGTSLHGAFVRNVGNSVINTAVLDLQVVRTERSPLPPKPPPDPKDRVLPATNLSEAILHFFVTFGDETQYDPGVPTPPRRDP